MMTTRQFAVALAATAALAISASADDSKSTATVGAKGATTFSIARTLADGAPLVAGTVTMPPDWRFYGSSFETLNFVPKSAKYDRPNLSLAITQDNLEPGEVAAAAKATASEPQKKIIGGGKLVKTITAPRDVSLGAHLHGIVASYEIDATKERSVHYVETRCLVWGDGQPFVFSLIGFAEMPDAGIVPAVEKACGTVALTLK